VYSIYSAGDGVILQHDVAHMNKVAIKLDDIISATNTSVQSQVSQILINYFHFSHFRNNLVLRHIVLQISQIGYRARMNLCVFISLISRMSPDTTVALRTASFLSFVITV